MVRNHHFSLAALIGVVSLSLAGCGWFGGKAHTSTMSSTAEAPAAMGTINSERTDDGNTKFSIKVKNLAAPYQVVEGSRTYVVWLKPLDTDDPPQNIGVLQPGNDLKANLDGITPYTNFEVYVTAEPTGTPSSPSEEHRVLSGMVRRGA